MKNLLTYITLVILIFLIGCSKKEPKEVLIGKWNVTNTENEKLVIEITKDQFIINNNPSKYNVVETGDSYVIIIAGPHEDENHNTKLKIIDNNNINSVLVENKKEIINTTSYWERIK